MTQHRIFKMIRVLLAKSSCWQSVWGHYWAAALQPQWKSWRAYRVWRTSGHRSPQFLMLVSAKYHDPYFNIIFGNCDFAGFEYPRGRTRGRRRRGRGRRRQEITSDDDLACFSTHNEFAPIQLTSSHWSRATSEQEEDNHVPKPPEFPPLTQIGQNSSQHQKPTT